MSKPTFDKKRPVSWSFLSAFEHDPEGWYRKYVLGKQDRSNPEMEFGKNFADSCEARKPLAPVTLLSEMEHEFAAVFDKIPLIGYGDTFCKDTGRELGEYKTGVNPWNQKRVDEHGQIDMYLLMHWLKDRVRPEEVRCFLEWIPTMRVGRFNGDFSGHDYAIIFATINPVGVVRFETKRTMADILRFGSRLKSVYAKAEKYCENHA